MASDYFLCGRVTYELLVKTWAKIKGGPYLDRMNSIPKLVASRTLTELAAQHRPHRPARRLTSASAIR
jgi:hypothetical protein